MDACKMIPDKLMCLSFVIYFSVFKFLFSIYFFVFLFFFVGVPA